MLVSVIAPCRNERDHVLGFCDAVARQRLPEGTVLEVLVAEGGSDDGTRELLDARAAADARFVRVDNPGFIVSVGLNRCIARARGEVLVRMDLHSDYDRDYIAQCLAALARTGAANVGGPWRAESPPAPGRANAMQRAIAAAFQSRWVVGGARSRDLGYEGPIETVYLGCWPRQTFERHGGFDETLVRNQDDEHNLRLCRAGALVWQSALIRSRYRPRATLGQLFAQQRQYGYWKPFVMRKHGRPGSLRQLAPGGLLALLGLLALGAWASPAARAGLVALLAIYGAYAVLASLAAVKLAGESASESVGNSADWAVLLRLPFVIGAYHLGYGAGSLRGWADVLLRGAPSPAFGALTR